MTERSFSGPLVDAHMHFWKIDPPRHILTQTLPDVPLPKRDAPVEELLADMQAAGMTQAVLGCTSTAGNNNQYVVDTVTEYRTRFVGHGLIDPDARQRSGVAPLNSSRAGGTPPQPRTGPRSRVSQGGTRLQLPLPRELAIIREHLPFLLADDQEWSLGRTVMTIWQFGPRQPFV